MASGVTADVRSGATERSDPAGGSSGQREATGGRGQPSADGLPVLDPVGNFEKISRIGEGTYGVVYKARDRTTGEMVALKKIRMERERHGVPVTSLRELRVLQACKHVNIVELKSVATGRKSDSVFLVFEYVEHDLGRLLDSMKVPFRESEIKCLMIQLLEAVAFLHDHWVVHRDLKLSNMLMSHAGVLKLCDFGLARSFRPYDVAYTPNTVTLWYRPPELLLGSEKYTEAVDMWAVGCIFGEFLKHEALLPGRTDVQQLELIFKLLGSPSERIWPGLRDMPLWSKVNVPHQPFSFIQQEFPGLSSTGLDLMCRLLCYDPEKRISARAALKHPYFKESPNPKSPEDMPTFPSAHNATQTPPAVAPQPEARARPAQQPLQKRRVQDSRFGEMFDVGRPAATKRTAR